VDYLRPSKEPATNVLIRSREQLIRRWGQHAFASSRATKMSLRLYRVGTVTAQLGFLLSTRPLDMTYDATDRFM
jgi:hypothetical protein